MTGDFLPNGNPTTERLLADAEQRLRIAEQLPAKLSAITGWAMNDDKTVRTTVNVHGALIKLELAESALAMGPEALGNAIVGLAERASKAALTESVGVLSQSLGDRGTIELARSLGLDEHIDPPAPVLDYTPGVDPNADKWTVIEADEPAGSSTSAARSAEEDVDVHSIDFSSLRSDR